MKIFPTLYQPPPYIPPPPPPPPITPVVMLTTRMPALFGLGEFAKTVMIDVNLMSDGTFRWASYETED